MPITRRRRRGRKARRVSVGATLLVLAAVAVVLILVIGSLVEVHAQSAPYRRATTRGYVVLVTPVFEASEQTGSRLATLIDHAPSMQVGSYPKTARAVLQQGLDQAVTDADDAQLQAQRLVPPSPSGGLGAQLDGVLDARATAVTQLRTAIDGLLDMAPLPVAGAATTADDTAPPSISVGQAARAMGAAGAALAAADRQYAAVAAQLRGAKGSDGVRTHLPTSTWVPAKHPVLGSTQLANAAATFDAAQGLRPIHSVRVVAVGLTPAAVPAASGGSGVIGVTCDHPVPSAPGGSGSAPSSGPAVLPPTTTVTAQVTVTNCGTANETGITVSAALILDDAPGHAPPPSGAAGSSARLRVASLPAGASTALTFPSLKVAGGHTYQLAITASVPEGQSGQPGTVQSLFLQVAS